jgi:hypothetical protein
MIDPGRTSRSAEEGPGRRGILDRGPSVLPGDWGVLGNAAHIISVQFQPSKRGAEGRRLCAPSPLPKCPHTRKEKISNATMKLRLG